MIELLWFSGELIIQGFTEYEFEVVTAKLRYEHKSIARVVGQEWKSTVEREWVHLYRELPGLGTRAIVTYQGMIDRVGDNLAAKGVPYVVIDRREPMPNPDFSKVHGFWHTQFSTLLKVLSQRRSGILEAPTRYGKTSILVNIMRAFPGLPTVLAAPGVDLLGQLVTELKEALPGRDIKGLFSGSRDKFQSHDITICSLDSLEKIQEQDIKLLLVDEPHACAAPSRVQNVAKFKHARILGVGATAEGRFDGADIIVRGLIGPTLFKKTFKEAVKEGAICPIVVYMFKITFDPWKCFDRQHAYKRLIFANEQFNALVQQLCWAIPQEWQTIVFADTAKQIDLIHLMVQDGVPAIASRMSKKERAAKFEEMKAGTIKRCIATNIYSTGVTFPDLRCVINAEGGGGSITGTQKPGRLAQKRPGKAAGYLIDFMFVAKDWENRDDQNFKQDDKWSAVVNDGFSRLRVYKQNGYDIRYVTSVDDIFLE